MTDITSILAELGYATWDKQGQAIDHEFGNLVRRKNSNDSIS